MGRRSKDILFLILAVVALVIAFYTFLRKPPPAPAPKETAATSAEPEKPEAAQAPGREAGKAAQQGTALTGPAGSARNPFQMPAAGAPAAAPGGTRARPGETPQETPAPEGPEAEAAATALFPGARPAAAAAQPAPRAEAESQGLTLHGIVAGKETMAVIREGDRRYYVRQGDRVGDRYRVQAITQKEVVLVSSEGKVILRMGGRQ